MFELDSERALVAAAWPAVAVRRIHELDARAQDVCEPLLAIADFAGGDWPDRARAGLVELYGHPDAAIARERIRAAFRQQATVVALPASHEMSHAAVQEAS